MAQGQGQFHRPLGVTLLAVGAGLAALAEIWRMLVFLGIVNFTFVGKSVSFPEAQWGQAFWALILAAIWAWVAMGFWNVRAYAVQFGIFISLFTIIFGVMALLFGSTMEAETVPWLLAGVIFFYLSYPGVQQQFMEHELELMTPAQRAAFEQMRAANAAMMQAQAGAAPAAAAAPAPRWPRRRTGSRCGAGACRAAHRSARSRGLTEQQALSQGPGSSIRGLLIRATRVDPMTRFTALVHPVRSGDG